jgi:hypothetical protein
MARSTEVEGSSAEAAAQFDRELSAIGQGMFLLDSCILHAWRRGDIIKALKVQVKSPDGRDIMIVCTARIDDVDVVTFSSGSSIREALVGLGRRLRNGSVVWRKDDYATQ